MSRTKLQGKVLASGLAFPEGPIAMEDGSILVVEIQRGRLTRVLPDGELQTVAEVGGGPNGGQMGRLSGRMGTVISATMVDSVGVLTMATADLSALHPIMTAVRFKESTLSPALLRRFTPTARAFRCMALTISFLTIRVVSGLPTLARNLMTASCWVTSTMPDATVARFAARQSIC